jgi:hypothetical protein
LEIAAIRQTVVQDKTRVVIEFTGEFDYHSNRLRAPERIYFDFPQAKMRTGLRSSYPRESGGLVGHIRIAEPVPGTTRVVLDLLEEATVSLQKLANPARLLIDLSSASGPTLQSNTNKLPSEDDAPGRNARQEALPAQSSHLEASNRIEASPVQSQSSASSPHKLTLSPASATPGTFVAVRLELHSAAGEEPLALQWDFSYASPKLGIEEGDIVAGDVANSSDKSLVCAGRVVSAGEYVYRCILAGGLKQMPSGVVAVINFRVRPHAELGACTVRTSGALAVTKDGKQHALAPSEADVTIR